MNLASSVRIMTEHLQAIVGMIENPDLPIWARRTCLRILRDGQVYLTKEQYTIYKAQQDALDHMYSTLHEKR